MRLEGRVKARKGEDDDDQDKFKNIIKLKSELQIKFQ